MTKEMLMRPTTAVCGLLVAAGIVVSVQGVQRPTIPELIEKAKPRTPQWGPRVREVALREFDEAVMNSDLIVVASLRKLRTYLSADETELYTDFQVIPAHTVAARPLPAASKPGQQPMIVRQWGGTTVINGARVELRDADFPLLPADTPLLLLLTFNPELQKYEVFGTSAGVFEFDKDQKVKHLSTSPLPPSYDKVVGVDIATAINEIRRLGR